MIDRLKGFMWAAQVEALSSRYRLLLVDFHGHGGSSAPQRAFTLEEMADDVVAAVQSLGFEHFGYVGHYMGGMVGMGGMRNLRRGSGSSDLDRSYVMPVQPLRLLYRSMAPCRIDRCRHSGALLGCAPVGLSDRFELGPAVPGFYVPGHARAGQKEKMNRSWGGQKLLTRDLKRDKF